MPRVTPAAFCTRERVHALVITSVTPRSYIISLGHPSLYSRCCHLGVASASAAEPWWQLSSSSAPAHLQPGACEGAEHASGSAPVRPGRCAAENLGDLPVSGSTTPVTITDVLPAGVMAKGIARVRTSSGVGTTGGGG